MEEPRQCVLDYRAAILPRRSMDFNGAATGRLLALKPGEEGLGCLVSDWSAHCIERGGLASAQTEIDALQADDAALRRHPFDLHQTQS